MYLEDFTIKELIQICQKYKIKKYSGLRKIQLIRHIRKFLNNKNHEEIVIYTWDECPFCVKAYKLIKKHNIKCTKKRVVVSKKASKSEKKQAKLNLNEMIKRTGQSSVPQIYINGKYIGGFMELKRYLENH